MITQADRERFSRCCRDGLCSEREKNGIGTLGERTLHAVLKNFFEPDITHHEKKVGRYIADIKNGDKITEIQTRAFGSMRKKLEAFTKEYTVNIVFPIAYEKYISWIDPESGEVRDRRKSPKPGQVWDILRELYALRPIMPLNKVEFTLVLMQMEEFRLLNGWSHDKKRGSARYERIPTELSNIITLKTASDYDILIPPSLDGEFTCAKFAKAAKMSPRTAGYAVRTLVSLGAIKHTKEEGKAYVYKRCFK